MRPKGNADELHRRRLRAMKLLDQGHSQAEVARRVDAHVYSVRRWRKAWRAGGDEALRPKPVSGAPPKLTPGQKDELARDLAAGAKKAGFDTDLWTGRRMAAFIQSRFGVTYHEHYVLELVRSLNFTPQRPEPVAREKDPDAKARWLRGPWPAMKKKGGARGRVAGVSR